MVTPRAIGGPNQDPDEIIDPSPRPYYPNGLRYRDIYCLGCHRFNDCCECRKKYMRTVKDIFYGWGVLDSEGKHTNGTDKETNHHYGDAYESIFETPILREVKVTEEHSAVVLAKKSIREDVKLMMEIGIADGSSLLAWSEVFPNARCVGLDIHHPSWASREGWNDRMEFHLGDQRSKEDCERAANGRLFDFICEDATHSLPNTLLTLYWLWPCVKPGGLYVVEEWDGVDRKRITNLFPQAEIVDTQSPFGGIESLVVFRKPLI